MDKIERRHRSRLRSLHAGQRRGRRRRHPDHRHVPQAVRRGDHAHGGKHRPHRLHLERQRHDRAEHGDHARLHDHRRRHRAARSSGDARPVRLAHVQLSHRGRRHQSPTTWRWSWRTARRATPDRPASTRRTPTFRERPLQRLPAPRPRNRPRRRRRDQADRSPTSMASRPRSLGSDAYHANGMPLTPEQRHGLRPQRRQNRRDFAPRQDRALRQRSQLGPHPRGRRTERRPVRPRARRDLAGRHNCLPPECPPTSTATSSATP